MKTAVIAVLIVLFPAALLAGQTMGVYFTSAPGQMWYSPMGFEMFIGYVYGHALDCYVDAVEFAVELPPGIILSGWSVPETSLTLGDPVSGLAVTYWPPLNGFDPGYNLLVTLEFMTLPDGACRWFCGQNINAPLRIVNHPVSGAIRQSCWPTNTLVDVIGLTSLICPCGIGVEQKSWGAIKSLF